MRGLIARAVCQFGSPPAVAPCAAPRLGHALTPPIKSTDKLQDSGHSQVWEMHCHRCSAIGCRPHALLANMPPGAACHPPGAAAEIRAVRRPAHPQTWLILLHPRYDCHLSESLTTHVPPHFSLLAFGSSTTFTQGAMAVKSNTQPGGCALHKQRLFRGHGRIRGQRGGVDQGDIKQYLT